MAINGVGGGSTPQITPNPNDDNKVTNGDGTPGSNGTTTVGGKDPISPTNPTSPTPIPVNVIAPTVTAPRTTTTPLDRPKIVLPADTSNLSVSDLIELIQSEIHKTSDALAEIQKVQINQDSLKQQNANKEQIDALNKAADQIVEAQKEKEAMEDVQWAFMALSIFMTVCTAGALGPFFGPLMVAATVVTQVPIEGKNFSGWITEGVGKGLGEFEKLCMRGVNWASHSATGKSTMTNEEEAANDKKIEDSEGYQAMAIMTYLEVVTAIFVAVVTFGAAAGPAAGVAAEAIGTEVAEEAATEVEAVVEEAVETALDEAAEVTEEVMEEVMEEASTVAEDVAEGVEDVSDVAEDSQKGLQQLTKLQRAVGLTQTIGDTAKSLAMDGMQIHTAYLEYQNSSNLSDADKIKAYTKFLQQILNSEEDFLKQIIESQVNIADTVKSIMQTEHSTNMHIANLTTHA